MGVAFNHSTVMNISIFFLNRPGAKNLKKFPIYNWLILHPSNRISSYNNELIPIAPFRFH
jgi:hypothetical protein